MAALDALETDETPPDHVIVAFGRREADGADATKFFQAGDYSHHAQQGLLAEAAAMIRESGT